MRITVKEFRELEERHGLTNQEATAVIHLLNIVAAVAPSRRAGVLRAVAEKFRVGLEPEIIDGGAVVDGG